MFVFVKINLKGCKCKTSAAANSTKNRETLHRQFCGHFVPLVCSVASIYICIYKYIYKHSLNTDYDLLFSNLCLHLVRNSCGQYMVDLGQKCASPLSTTCLQRFGLCPSCDNYCSKTGVRSGNSCSLSLGRLHRSFRSYLLLFVSRKP